MRIAFYSPYLDSFGGGERYLSTAASIFAQHEEVVIFWDDPEILRRLELRFNLDLKNVRILPNIFGKNLWERWKTLKNFDLIFILSDGSIPVPIAAKNILHFQQPFKIAGKTLKNQLKLKKYIVICNSNFTKEYIDESFRINSKVVYPPVNTNFFTPSQKENVILSVGRFLLGGQGKKQEILIEAFRSALNGWQLWLAGGVGDKDYFHNLQKKAKNLPVKFFPNIPAGELKELYGKAAIYWHAKGFGEDLNIHPEFAEHFGISVVEAQSSGCVPVVFKAGGLTEIIEDGTNGFFWLTPAKLIKITIDLIKDENLRTKLSKNASLSAKKFSTIEFERALNEIIAA